MQADRPVRCLCEQSSRSGRTTSSSLQVRLYASALDLLSDFAYACSLAEDYLHSVITLVNELARLCPNSIVNSDFTLPLKISRFCKEIHAGFGLLNLKNDSLRKRYDGMKYDIKKMEEVVYDISLRGLVPSAAGEAASSNKRIREDA